MLFATFGLMLMKRLATWPPSKTQSTVSPAKTLATFSSAGSTINVDCSKAGADHRRRVRFGHGDGARRVRLKVLGLVARMAASGHGGE